MKLGLLESGLKEDDAIGVHGPVEETVYLRETEPLPAR
jgi:hypothetical protein